MTQIRWVGLAPNDGSASTFRNCRHARRIASFELPLFQSGVRTRCCPWRMTNPFRNNDSTAVTSRCSLCPLNHLLNDSRRDVSSYQKRKFKLIFCLYESPSGSRDSSVGIATGYGLDDRRVWIPFPLGPRSFFSPRRPHRFWGLPSLLSNGCRGIKRLGREAVHSTPTGTEVKKMGIYTSTPPYAFISYAQGRLYLTLWMTFNALNGQHQGTDPQHCLHTKLHQSPNWQRR
jgi:hypothetical protein